MRLPNKTDINDLDPTNPEMERVQTWNHFGSTEPWYIFHRVGPGIRIRGNTIYPDPCRQPSDCRALRARFFLFVNSI